MKPTIFISHSAKDAAARARLDGIEKQLKKCGFDVLLDRKRLQAGQRWRQEIHTWMSRCHGAVILFSKNAYEDSEWVLKEATILSWRLALDPAFKLVPVLLPPVNGTWLSKDKYEPLALGEVQGVDGSKPPAKVAEKVVQLLAPLKTAFPATPLDEVLRFLGDTLRSVKPATLQHIAAKLGKQIQWDASDTADQFAREILHVDLERVKDVLLELQPIVGADAASKIVDYVAPFCIDPVIATPVARVALRDPVTPPRDAVALNATDVDVGELHIQRARRRLLLWIIVPVTPGGSGADAKGSLLRQVREAIFGHFPQFRDRPALLTQELENARKDGDPYFVLIQKYVAPPVLQKLRDEYPDITFVVLTGDEAASAYEKKNAGVRLLQPPLDRRAEEKLIGLLFRARQIAKR